jgi:hypothetical protein
MNTHALAKTKLRKLTSRVEKTLYELKFSPSDYKPLTEQVYGEVLSVCNNNKIPFPLIKTQNEIYLNGLNPKLFSILHTLADSHGIVLDYTKIR